MDISHTAISLLLGFCAGILSGLMGVGGGSVLVPGMVYLLNTSQYTAHGTSLVVILATALVAGTSYYKKGLVDGKLAIMLGICATAGSAIGAALMVLLPADMLRRIFGAFIVIVGIRLLMERRDRKEVTAR